MYQAEGKKYTMTTVSGEATQTVTGIKGRRLIELYVNPTTSTTVYTLTIIDKDNHEFPFQAGWTGKYISNSFSNFPQYMIGNITFKISSASKNEAFDVKLTFLEEVY